jgi:hypothetical protein
MARRLVLGGVEEWNDVQAIAAVVPLAGQAALRLATLASAQPVPQGEQVWGTEPSETVKTSF